MLRVIVDSGSSIKQWEKEKYGVEIIPLHINLDGKEYLDGINLSDEDFYKALTVDKIFPKTSLPSIAFVEDLINGYVDKGDEVVYLALSSGLSGTYNTIRMLFEDNDKVCVIDTKSAAGGIRILVEEINKDRSRTLKDIEKRILEIIPRVRLCAIPDTLEYLYRGGRLSKTGYLLGGMLGIVPIIAIEDGKAVAAGKKRGAKNAVSFILDKMEELGVDTDHSIIAEYSYTKDNAEGLVSILSDEYKRLVTAYDNLSPTIASHWGPNAYGLFFVSKK
ncbi:MAG: DegV family protein [Clostridia bacterium]|nr:DegV family protein [Clostridia bacterium]